VRSALARCVVCGVRAPLPLLYRAGQGSCEGEYYPTHPHTASISIQCTDQRRMGRGGRGENTIVPLARSRLGWTSPPPSLPGCSLARPRPWCQDGLALVWSPGWASSLLLLFYAFSDGAFSLYSTRVWCNFLQSDNSVNTHGIR
jgi:hypothetical protein